MRCIGKSKNCNRSDTIIIFFLALLFPVAMFFPRHTHTHTVAREKKGKINLTSYDCPLVFASSVYPNHGVA